MRSVAAFGYAGGLASSASRRGLARAKEGSPGPRKLVRQAGKQAGAPGTKAAQTASSAAHLLRVQCA